MISALTTTWTLAPLRPFGLLATTNPGADICAVPTPVFLTWVMEHRVLVLRGFDPLLGEALPEYCEMLGELSAGNSAQASAPHARENIQGNGETRRGLPFHWAGAFTGRIPHYLFYQCEEAPPPDAGGQTLFCDTIRLLERTAPEDLALWQEIHVTYSGGAIDPRGGAVTAPLIRRHPRSGQSTLRFSEPLSGPNPVRLRISAIVEEKEEDFIDEMHMRLHDPAVCLAHAWKSGDIVIADNHALLHAHSDLKQGAPRKIRRVDIL
jgi:alpha-ketoglutarate-dependent taurine dioxygenase